jgi:hypothetical protein
MTLQPDDQGRRRRFGADGVGDGTEESAVERRDGATPVGTPVERHPEVLEETSEPVWVLPTIVLALVALSGSLLLFMLVGIAGLALWALHTPPAGPPEQHAGRFGFPMGGPFGGIGP